MSLVLRHEPGSAGLTLDHGGWAEVDALLNGMHAAGLRVSLDDIETVVATSDKKRFTLSDDGTKIRAAQGHSIPVDLGLEPKEPPDVLFHGTAEKNVASILELGIHAGSRQHVHLSKDTDTAVKVGQRHGKPVVLTVDAQRMFQDGNAFWLSENGVWLTDFVAAKYVGAPS